MLKDWLPWVMTTMREQTSVLSRNTSWRLRGIYFGLCPYETIVFRFRRVAEKGFFGARRGWLSGYIVFGHKHHTLVQRIDGILYVNPGSPTLLDYRKGPGTVGILDVSSGKADASIVQLQ